MGNTIGENESRLQYMRSYEYAYVCVNECDVLEFAIQRFRAIYLMIGCANHMLYNYETGKANAREKKNP